MDTFRQQIRMLGFSYDWDREVNTTDPDYYRWTQWIFLATFSTAISTQSTEKPSRSPHLAFELENEEPGGRPRWQHPPEPQCPRHVGHRRRRRPWPFLKWAVLPADEKRDIINGQERPGLYR